MSPRMRVTMAAAFATVLTAIGLLRLVRSGSWFLETVAAVAIVAVAGSLLRRTRLPSALVVLCQLALLVMFDTGCLVPGSALLAVLPGPQAWHALAHLGTQAGNDIQTMSPPVLPTPGIGAVLVLALSGVALLVDALAATYGLASLAGLPLLALYLVPATRLPGGLNWLCFVIAATAYLALLSAEGRERVTRWGRPLARSGADSDTRNQPVGSAGHQIGLTALAAALVVPILMPSISTSSWGLPSLGGHSGGAGDGGGSSDITISEQVNIKRELTSTSNIPLLRYSTNAGVVRDQYLRLLALDSFNGDGWQPVTLPYTSLGKGRLPTAPGFSDTYVDRTPVTTSVQVVGALTTSPLPLPYPPTAVSVSGSDSNCPSTLEVFGPNNSVHQGLRYSVTSLDVEPNAQQLQDDPRVGHAAAKALAPDLALPSNLPPVVKATAEQVTGGSTNPYEEAIRLQDYFQRDFTYSLDVPPQDGPSAIVSFLENKIGYCQQFAGTMAAMARTLGIPARVAVGFTAGTRQRDGSYIVTTHDVHSWPELYFPGTGWVRFEPTAQVASAVDGGSTPGYAQAEQQGQGGSITPQHDSDPQPQQPGGSSGCGTGSSPVTGRLSARPGADAGPDGEPAGSARNCVKGSGGGSTAGSGTSGSRSHAFSWLGPFGAVPRAVEGWLSRRSALTLAVGWTAVALLVLLTVPMLLRRRVRKNRRRTLRAAATAAGRAGRYGGEAGTARHRDGDGLAPIDLTPQRLQGLAAWDELRDCATDLGYDWPTAATYRQLRDQLITTASLDVPACEAIGRVTALAERARYAPRVDTDATGVFADIGVVRAGLAAPRDRWQRVRATVLPASSLRRLRARRALTATRAAQAVARLLHGRTKEDAPAG